MKKIFSTALLLTIVILSACGGGGGNGGGGQGGPTCAIITLSAEGTLPTGTTIGGAGLTVNLPTGMNVKTDAGGNVDNNVVTASGFAQGQATVIAVYSAATATEQGRLYVTLASTSAHGLGVGEFAKVNCGIAAGSNPQASGISLTNIQVVDTNGAVISEVTATFSAAVQ